MTTEEIAEILAKPYAQQLLNGPEPARMAYNGLDGDPRVIPIGFWTEGERVVMATVPKSAKVAALRANPKVALTIDQGAFPPKVLLIHGTAEVELVEGIPDGYLAAGRKVMTDDQYPDWVEGVRASTTRWSSSRSPRPGPSCSTSRPPSLRQSRTSSSRSRPADVATPFRRAPRGSGGTGRRERPGCPHGVVRRCRTRTRPGATTDSNHRIRR